MLTCVQGCIAASSCRNVGRQRSTASMSGSPQTAGQLTVLLDRRRNRGVRPGVPRLPCVAERSPDELPLVVGKHRRQGRRLPPRARARRCTPPMKPKSKHRDPHRSTILPRSRPELLENQVKNNSPIWRLQPQAHDRHSLPTGARRSKAGWRRDAVRRDVGADARSTCRERSRYRACTPRYMRECEMCFPRCATDSPRLPAVRE